MLKYLVTGMWVLFNLLWSKVIVGFLSNLTAERDHQSYQNIVTNIIKPTNTVVKTSNH